MKTQISPLKNKQKPAETFPGHAIQSSFTFTPNTKENSEEQFFLSTWFFQQPQRQWQNFHRHQITEPTFHSTPPLPSCGAPTFRCKFPRLPCKKSQSPKQVHKHGQPFKKYRSRATPGALLLSNTSSQKSTKLCASRHSGHCAILPDNPLMAKAPPRKVHLSAAAAEERAHVFLMRRARALSASVPRPTGVDIFIGARARLMHARCNPRVAPLARRSICYPDVRSPLLSLV